MYLITHDTLFLSVGKQYQFSTAETNCQTLSSLEQHKFMMSQFCFSQVYIECVGSFLYRFPRANSKELAKRTLVFWEVRKDYFQVHSGWWQSKFPRSYRTEVHIFILALTLTPTSLSLGRHVDWSISAPRITLNSCLDSDILFLYIALVCFL